MISQATKTYRIIATVVNHDHDTETYQVVDSDGVEYCRNAGGGIEGTSAFSLAVERYCELTGEDPDLIDTAHEEIYTSREYDGSSSVLSQDEMISATIFCFQDDDADVSDYRVRETAYDDIPCLEVVHVPSGKSSKESGSAGLWNLDGTAFDVRDLTEMTATTNITEKAAELGRLTLEIYRSEFGTTPEQDGTESVGDWDSVAWQDDWRDLRAVAGATDKDYEACLKAWNQEFWRAIG